MESEKDIERYLVAQMKERGGVAFKLPATLNRSWPDRLLLFPGGTAAFAELKSTGKKATKGQLHIIEQLRSLGFPAEVLDTKQAVTTYLDAIQK